MQTQPMKTWHDFANSLAAAQQDVPPFRPTNLATGASPASSTSQSCFVAGLDRLDFHPSRLQFGSSSWPPPPPPPLLDAALTIHLGDLYDLPNYTTHNVGSPRIVDGTRDRSSAEADTSTPGATELLAAVRTWLLAKTEAGDGWTAASQDLAHCSQGATPEDWLQILGLLIGSDVIEVSPHKSKPAASQQCDCSTSKLSCASVGVGDALCSLMAVCSGLGECVLSHALPFILANLCEETELLLPVKAGAAGRLNPVLEKVLRKVRYSY